MREYLSGRIRLVKADIASVKHKSTVAFIVKLMSFLAIVLFLFLGWNTGMQVICGVGGCLLVYVVFYLWDRRLMWRNVRLEKMLAVYEHELQSIDGDFSAFDAGERFVNPEHEYSFDLDIFGCGSLFNRICRAVTGLGRERLAALLQNMADCEQEIMERQKAVREMSHKSDWYMDFLATEYTESHIRDILLSVERDENKNARFLSPSFIWMWWVPFTAFWLSLLGALLGWVSGAVPALLFSFNLVYVGFWSKTRQKLFAETLALRREFDRYEVLLQKIRSENFESQILKSAKNRLFAEDCSADKAFRSVSRILSNIELRGNFVMYLVLEGLFLSDMMMIRMLLLWKRKYMPYIDGWADSISDMDAFVSLGNYAFGHAHNVYPFISADDEMAVEANGVYHPFLCRERAVTNDFLQKKGEMFIITGANMAGKSTLLRTIGVNLVMANAGLPVCACRFGFSLMQLFSNMRTTDDLNRNISYFNAELIRLEQLIKYCRANVHTFIILDEILRGTNSADKLHGSRLFLEYVMKCNVTGIVATHDLELSKVEREGSPYKNYCFEIDMSEKVTYSYKMSKGVAHNMNATYLLNKILGETGSLK